MSMRRRFITLSATILAIGLATTTVLAVKPEDNRATKENGRVIYERACLWCHGVTGKGDGPAGWFLGRYSSPRPRDFSVGNFKFRSTASGDLPTDQDLFRTVTKGIPGYMPSFASLTEKERWQVITYVKSFNPAFQTETSVPLLLSGPSPPASPESIETGRALYASFECQTCHGSDGRGDGPVSQAGDLKDSSGLRILAADLTRPLTFKNGSSAQDLVRTLMTGLDGTPMPSYAAQFTGKEDEAWYLAQYILSLSSESFP